MLLKEIRVPRNSQRCICERKGQNDAASFTKPGSGFNQLKMMHTSDNPLDNWNQSTLHKHPENC